jgi:hypothetical protein
MKSKIEEIHVNLCTAEEDCYKLQVWAREDTSNPIQQDDLVTSLDSINYLASTLNQLTSKTSNSMNFPTATPEKVKDVKLSLLYNMKTESKEIKQEDMITKKEDAFEGDFITKVLNPPKKEPKKELTEDHKLWVNLEGFTKKAEWTLTKSSQNLNNSMEPTNLFQNLYSNSTKSENVSSETKTQPGRATLL